MMNMNGGINQCIMVNNSNCNTAWSNSRSNNTHRNTNDDNHHHQYRQYGAEPTATQTRSNQMQWLHQLQQLQHLQQLKQLQQIQQAYQHMQYMQQMQQQQQQHNMQKQHMQSQSPLPPLPDPRHDHNFVMRQSNLVCADEQKDALTEGEAEENTTVATESWSWLDTADYGPYELNYELDEESVDEDEIDIGDEDFEDDSENENENENEHKDDKDENDGGNDESNDGDNDTDEASAIESRSYSKMKSCLRWIIFNDHIDDYANMLAIDDDIKIFIINQCSKHSSTHRACIKWSKKWNLINNKKCRKAVHVAMSHSMSNHKVNRSSSNNGYHAQLTRDCSAYDNLPACAALDVFEDIVFVNNASTFEVAKQILSAEKHVIGLDLEYMIARFSIHSAPKYCQILQVATSTKTVLFDLETIDDKQSVSASAAAAAEMIDVADFDELLHRIFGDSSVVKVGMAFRGDLTLLSKQYPWCKCFRSCVRNYFELHELLMFMRTKMGISVFGINEQQETMIKKKLSLTSTKREGGLATIVRHILQQRLSKREQLSNWSRRPLRIAQLQYAALDAKIEIEIYHKLVVEYSPLLESHKKQWCVDLMIT
mmetsp:Transcript_50245/g.83659  ORF Transcript_50245/g.83659 Transcript_50245/m.83659 type:complete len:597 (-) Transcript_50245:1349-3139(-)